MAEGAGKRPFWMHQLVEYILGGAMVASGMQSQRPIVPSVIGAFILVYAGATRGALSAFHFLDRRIHRVTDPVLVLVIIAAALQPWVGVRNDTRFIMIAIALVYAVVWWGSSFHERRRPTPAEKSAARAAKQAAAASVAPGDRSTEIGKKAGRAVGVGINMARKAKAARQDR